MHICMVTVHSHSRVYILHIFTPTDVGVFLPKMCKTCTFFYFRGLYMSLWGCSKKKENCHFVWGTTSSSFFLFWQITTYSYGLGRNLKLFICSLKFDTSPHEVWLKFKFRPNYIWVTCSLKFDTLSIAYLWLWFEIPG